MFLLTHSVYDNLNHEFPVFLDNNNNNLIVVVIVNKKLFDYPSSLRLVYKERRVILLLFRKACTICLKNAVNGFSKLEAPQ